MDALSYSFMPTTRDYTPEFQDKALQLAAVIGIFPAARQLEMPRGTLQAWTQDPRLAERWSELRRIHAPKWRERAAIPLEELVDEYAQTLAKALRRAHESVDEIEPRDLGNFIRSIAVAQGVANEHVGKLRGQPSQIVEHKHSAEQLESGLKRLLEEATAIDSTAVELPSGEPDAIQQHGPSRPAEADEESR